MKLFGSNNNRKNIAHVPDETYPAKEHASATFPSPCLGEQCPNFKGKACKDSFYEWVGAKATENEGRDLGQPPLQAEAIYVTYGQVCVKGAGYQGVRYRIHDYGREHFNLDETGLIMHGDSAFGEGIDVDVLDVKLNDDGSTIEQLKQTFDGWGPGGLK